MKKHRLLNYLAIIELLVFVPLFSCGEVVHPGTVGSGNGASGSKTGGLIGKGSGKYADVTGVSGGSGGSGSGSSGSGGEGGSGGGGGSSLPVLEKGDSFVANLNVKQNSEQQNMPLPNITKECSGVSALSGYKNWNYQGDQMPETMNFFCSDIQVNDEFAGAMKIVFKDSAWTEEKWVTRYGFDLTAMKYKPVTTDVMCPEGKVALGFSSRNSDGDQFFDFVKLECVSPNAEINRSSKTQTVPMKVGKATAVQPAEAYGSEYQCPQGQLMVGYQLTTSEKPSPPFSHFGCLQRVTNGKLVFKQKSNSLVVSYTSEEYLALSADVKADLEQICESPVPLTDWLGNEILDESGQKIMVKGKAIWSVGQDVNDPFGTGGNPNQWPWTWKFGTMSVHCSTLEPTTIPAFK